MSKDLSQAASSLKEACNQCLPSERILSVVVGDEPLSLAHPDHESPWVFPAHWQGLLAMGARVAVLQGDAQIVAPNNGALVKLQVFIDKAMPVVEHGRCLPLASLAVAPQVLNSEQTLRRWYISQTLAGSPDSAAFARLLRQSESYRLVRFLLEQSAASEKLNDLARRYGVSVSHFRRLCHQALGGAAKPELREWRSAQALLSLALSPGKSSLTEVALEFGFASSSHFSKEIRELVGVAPSSLIDITRLSSK